MQLKLTEDIKKQKEEIEVKIKEQNEEERLRQKGKEIFEANFKLGSTTVILKRGIYLFHGDIKHCGREAIVHNATKIKDAMVRNHRNYGHMDYNDLPTYSNSFDWEKEERKRKELYKNALYLFKENEIIKVSN